MKGMLFFIIGLIIIFGLFKLTHDNTSLSGEPLDEIDKQETNQALE